MERVIGISNMKETTPNILDTIVSRKRYLPCRFLLGSFYIEAKSSL